MSEKVPHLSEGLVAERPCEGWQVVAGWLPKVFLPPADRTCMQMHTRLHKNTCDNMWYVSYIHVLVIFSNHLKHRERCTMASGIYIVVDFSGTSTCSSLRVAWAVSIFLNENACSILGSKGLITICQLLFSSVQGWQRASKYFETGWAYRDSSACTRTCAGTFTGTCMRGCASRAYTSDWCWWGARQDRAELQESVRISGFCWRSTSHGTVARFSTFRFILAITGSFWKWPRSKDDLDDATDVLDVAGSE